MEGLEIILLYGVNFSSLCKRKYPYRPGIHMKLEFGRKLDVMWSGLVKLTRDSQGFLCIVFVVATTPTISLYVVSNISLEPMTVIRNTDCRISGSKFPSLYHNSLRDIFLEHFCHGATLFKVSPYATPEPRYASHVPFEGSLVYKRIIYTSCCSLCLLRKKWIGMGKKFYVPCIQTP